jgi:hypothetical protein
MHPKRDYPFHLSDPDIQRLIAEAALPEGLLPDIRSCIGVGLVRAPNAVFEVSSGLFFDIMYNVWGKTLKDSHLPALPLRAHGSYHTVGWDGATCWAVDADRAYWEDNGHGMALTLKVPAGADDRMKRSAVEAIEDCGGSGWGEVEQALGLKPRPPSWIRIALANKWTPPADLDLSMYDQS